MNEVEREKLYSLRWTLENKWGVESYWQKALGMVSELLGDGAGPVEREVSGAGSAGVSAPDLGPVTEPWIPRPRVALVVGHSPSEPGASTFRGESEFSNREKMAEMTKGVLEGMRIEAEIFYRKDGWGYGDAMRELGTRIDAFGPVFAIEMHFNAYNGRAHGCEFLFVSEAGKVVAVAFVDQWERSYPAVHKRRGPNGTGLIKADSDDHGYGFLTCCKAPACLLEPGFFDKPEEGSLFLDDPEREAVANAAAIRAAVVQLMERNRMA